NARIDQPALAHREHRCAAVRSSWSKRPPRARRRGRTGRGARPRAGRAGGETDFRGRGPRDRQTRKPYRGLHADRRVPRRTRIAPISSGILRRKTYETIKRTEFGRRRDERYAGFIDGQKGYSGMSVSERSEGWVTDQLSRLTGEYGSAPVHQVSWTVPEARYDDAANAGDAAHAAAGVRVTNDADEVL